MNESIDNLKSRVEDLCKYGSDYSDIYIQSSCGHSIHYENNQIDEISSTTSDGTGVRTILNGKTYYSHVPGNDVISINRAINEVTSLSFNRKIPIFASKSEPFSYSNISRPNFDFCHEINNSIRKQSSLVKQLSMRFSVSKKQLTMVLPNGILAYDTRFYSSFSAQVIVEKNGIIQTGYERYCLSKPHNEFWNNMTPFKICQKALERALLMLSAQRCPAGKMNVLLSGEAGGTIVHEACGHGLEADIIKKDFSVYRNNISKKVANENITMIDNPTIHGLYGSYDYDDEGMKSQKNILIENGILKSYLSDYISSKVLNVPQTGNGRRESYRSIPIPRMSNTYLLPGTSDIDTMLQKTDNGLYVKKMGGGEVNPTSGDFVFYVSEGYLIKKGKVLSPVKGATIIGNGPDTLNNIIDLGNTMTMDPGICGKSGQSVPVTDGQPSMLISGLTIGGNDE
ncbi:MAG: TldD/PmbA family protein [Synergistaceae bacterium]